METTPPATVLLIETHSPANPQARSASALAESLLKAGDSVQLHLMQDGATWLQQDPDTLRTLGRRHGGQLRITVDDVSLALRGVAPTASHGVATVIDADTLVRAICEPSTNTIWHS